MRANPPVPNVAVARALSKVALVVMVPEYRTSQVCCQLGCHLQTEEAQFEGWSCNHKKKWRHFQNNRLNRCCMQDGELLDRVSMCEERVRKLQGSRMRLCQQCLIGGPARYVDRDLNAACNIRTILQYYAEHLIRSA